MDDMETGSELADILLLAKEMEEKKAEDDRRRFEMLSSVVKRNIDISVKARAESGIETIWQEDQDYYEGVDQYNKPGVRFNKPTARDGNGPVTVSSTESKTSQCTAFFNITRQFVDSAAARCCDILLPQGDWNWGVKKTPIHDPVGSDERNKNVFELAQQAIAAKMVSKGEQRIKDWLVEARYHREYRKAIETAARIGTGILKGPFPVERKTKSIVHGELILDSKIAPSTKSINPWNFFPDPNCGDDIHRGDYVVERDYLSYKQLSDLRNIPGYKEDSIEKVLDEGPGKQYASRKKEKSENDLFEIWYYTGNIDVTDIDLIDERYKKEVDISIDEDGALKLCGCDEEKGKVFQSVVIVMVNDTVISGHLNTMQDGSFPYDVMCWQAVEDSPFGCGVARQMRVAQNTLLSAGRDLVDNLSLSSVPMLGMRRNGVAPENGKWEMRKGKVWWLTDELGKSINDAIQFIQVPSLQKELMEVMVMAGKMAEDSTGVNSLLQGQQGAAPDTVGGMELLHRNASALLRRIARISDENVTEPHIRRYYDWLLMYGEDDEKGDLQIEAIGSSVLVEREIEAIQAQTLLQFAQDPEFELSKPKIMQKVIKCWGIDPSDVALSEDEKAKRATQQQPQDPRLMAAQIKSQTDLQIANTRAEVDMQKIKKDMDRDALYAQGVTERNQITYQSHINELQLRRDLAILEYAKREKMNLDDIKAKLAGDSMKMAVQKELASMPYAEPAKQVLTPPTEPPQYAPDGMAYQQ